MSRGSGQVVDGELVQKVTHCTFFLEVYASRRQPPGPQAQLLHIYCHDHYLLKLMQFFYFLWKQNPFKLYKETPFTKY